MTKKELWQTVLGQIQFSVSQTNFATWFKNTHISSIEDGIITVEVENNFSKEWLENKYSSKLLKILRSVDKSTKKIKFVVKERDTSSTKKPKKETVEEEELGPQLKLNKISVDKKTNLNPIYNFDNFIVGRFNEMSQAAAWAVSENPGNVYNPLFIYGGVGLGKTHLLQATGNKIKENFSKKTIKYVPCERFVNGVVNAIKDGSISKFKKQLKKIDVLIMDDVQFFAGKEKSQEEFYHVYNLLYQSQKQIFLSSDKPPKSIPGLQERLQSRFEGGMISDITVPDYETRIAILQAKCNKKNMELNDEILDYIAENIKTNIRELEGALNRLLLFKKIHKKEPDLNTSKKLLKKITSKPKRKATFKEILKTVSDFYGIEKDDLFKKTRRREIVKPRQIAMYILREDLDESYPSIGRKFKGKDHTTAMYACKKISKKSEENEELNSELNLIRQKLYS